MTRRKRSAGHDVGLAAARRIVVKIGSALLVEEPRGAIRRSWLDALSDDIAALRTRDMIGEETLLWGSDYPHTDSTWPCSSQVLDEMFEGYSAETRDKITRTNVANLYNL